MNLHRRQFLKTSATGALAAGFAPGLSAKAGRKYRTALIGSGWWGMNVLKEAMAAGSAKVVGLCDVDEEAIDVSAEKVERLSGDSPKGYKDYRELLAKEKPEVVIIATPDHWHALPFIAACEAGAHVFVEKPTGHTIAESQAMVKAAQAAGITAQVGLHRRIGPHHVSGMKFLKSGAVGDIGMVRLFVAGGGGKETPARNQDPSDGLDWDLYCGPAPLRPFNTRIHPGGWRNFLDFANGTLGDWGVHWLDQVLWWTEEKAPKYVHSTGGRPVRGEAVLNDKFQTTDAPDTQVATYQFESFTATWEHRKYARNNSEKHAIGAYFYGTKGIFHMGWRDGWTFHPTDSKKKTIHEDHQLQEPDGHNLTLLWADFLRAIETKSEPVCGIEPSHRSSVLPMLGMLSYKLGRGVAWDGDKETIPNDPEAQKLLRREYREPWKYPA